MFTVFYNSNQKIFVLVLLLQLNFYYSDIGSFKPLHNEKIYIKSFTNSFDNLMVNVYTNYYLKRKERMKQFLKNILNDEEKRARQRLFWNLRQG